MEKSGKAIDVYTDGACLRNGKSHSSAGYGVYFGDNHPRNEGRYLDTAAPTNNKAELKAIERALEITSNDRSSKLNIYSDSGYAIKSVTDYSKNWKNNGWKTANGQDVKNKEQIQRIDQLVQDRQQHGGVQFHHVYGHSGNKGNDAADRLARDAAVKKTIFKNDNNKNNTKINNNTSNTNTNTTYKNKNKNKNPYYRKRYF